MSATMAAQARALVAARWLADAVKSNRVGPNLRILDASWYLPKMNRNAKDEFQRTHIPGASFFDIDECCDKSSEFDHMLPSKGEFADYVGNLGIGNDTHVVVYDASDFGSFSAPRVWWMFRVFGHSSVSVLDGGFKNWLREGHPVTEQYTKPQRTEFKATFNGSWVKTYQDILDNVKSKTIQVVDARANGRFRGVEPEPRASKYELWVVILEQFICGMVPDISLCSLTLLVQYCGLMHFSFFFARTLHCGQTFATCSLFAV